MKGGRRFRYRHALEMLREMLDSAGHPTLVRLVDDAMGGDQWAEMHCGGAMAAAISVLRKADAIRRGSLDTPATPQGTPQ
jgi:hypothetical protein